jgi:hypothetical protein
MCFKVVLEFLKPAQKKTFQSFENSSLNTWRYLARQVLTRASCNAHCRFWPSSHTRCQMSPFAHGSAASLTTSHKTWTWPWGKKTMVPDNVWWATHPQRTLTDILAITVKVQMISLRWYDGLWNYHLKKERHLGVLLFMTLVRTLLVQHRYRC